MKYTVKIGLILVGIIALSFTGSATYLIAQDNAPSVTKLFEETSYYLKDVTFIDANTGWAVGDTHWDQAQQQYVGTIYQNHRQRCYLDASSH